MEQVKELKKRGRKKGFKKVRKDGEALPPSLTNEYYKLKMREVRKKNPLYTKKYLFLLNFDGKNYLFKYKGEVLKNLYNVNNNKFFLFKFNDKYTKYARKIDFMKHLKKINKSEIKDEYIRMY